MSVKITDHGLASVKDSPDMHVYNVVFSMDGLFTPDQVRDRMIEMGFEPTGVRAIKNKCIFWTEHRRLKRFGDYFMVIES